MSVQGPQSSIKHGQRATYVVRVSTENGSASGVSVALTAQPSSQKPTFTSGCVKGDGTASCTVGSVSDSAPVSLHAQLPVATATSVSSVKLTATASVASTAKWTPPAATATTTVVAASASAVRSSAKATTSAAARGAIMSLGPIPDLNAEASTLIGAGNAAGLFPAITASPAPSAGRAPSGRPSGQGAEPVSDASTVSAGTPVMTAQVAGLIALGLAIMLTVTRLSVRRRSGPGGPGTKPGPS